MITVVGSGTLTSYGARTNTAVPAPAGVELGDLLLLQFFVLGAPAPVPTFPAGFASIGAGPTEVSEGPNNARMYVVSKVADASDVTLSSSAGSYTVTHTAASTQAAVQVRRGVDSVLPTPTANMGTGLVTTALGLTTARPDSMVLFFAHDFAEVNNPRPAPSGYTERADLPPSGARVLYIADRVYDSLTATGAVTQSNNNTGNPTLPWAAILVPLVPPIPPDVNPDYTEAIRAVIVGSACAIPLATYLGSPAVFTATPVPADAPYPNITVINLGGNAAQDGVRDFRPMGSYQIAVHAQNVAPPATDYRLISQVALCLRTLFHRKRNVLLDGWGTVQQRVTGPVDRPSVGQITSRVLTLNLYVAQKWP